jgi:hypothetical protein
VLLDYFIYMPMAEFRICVSFFIGQLQGLQQIAHWFCFAFPFA